MPRVIHTADTHIGYRQYHSDERRRDFLAAFESVIEDAIKADVDAVVHAGDLFHDKRPDLRDLQGTVSVLRRLRDADIPFFGIVGNHERKRDAQWLDLFADLSLATRLDTSPTLVDGVALYGIDYLTPASRAPDAVSFEPPAESAVTLVLGHGIIEGLPYGDWDLDALLDEASVDFDGVLLGDYHEHELEHRDGTVVTYSGSTERASADERTPRGYNLVTIEDGELSVSHRTVADTRRFEYIDVDLAEGEGESRVRDRLDEHDLEDAVVIVTVDGEGEPVSPAAIEEHAIEHGALVARVRDRRGGDGSTGGAGEVSVRFADPDRAVRAALAETEVSEAAFELDGLVRDGAIPDARVREQARSRIEELLEDDPAALNRSVEVDEPEEPSDTPPAEPAGAVESRDTMETEAGVQPTETQPSSPDGDGAATAADGADQPPPGGSEADETDGEAGSSETGDEDAEVHQADEAANTDGQASMGDYL